MELLEAILLGIIQGATEFLPISSSGHLLLIPSLFSLSEPDLNGIAIAHLGTLLAILVYFRQDLWNIFKAVLSGLRIGRPLATMESRLGWYIAIGTIPAAVAGLLFVDFIDSVLATPTVAAFMLMVTAVILVIGEQLLKGDKALGQMGWTDAIIIGLAQVAALIPGISRSGVTITAGLSRGLDRPSAARYSFLLGVPAIAGAGLLAILDLAQSPGLANQLPQIVATFLAAAIVGYVCIYFLLNWLRRGSLYPFAAYCAAFGLIYLIIIWVG